MQRAEEEDESSAIAEKEKLVKAPGTAAVPQQQPGSGLVARLPLSGCLSIILRLAVSLELQPREKSKQTTVGAKEQVQGKWERA